MPQAPSYLWPIPLALCFIPRLFAADNPLSFSSAYPLVPRIISCTTSPTMYHSLARNQRNTFKKHAVALLIVLGLASVRLTNVEPYRLVTLYCYVLVLCLGLGGPIDPHTRSCHVYLGHPGLGPFTFLLCYRSKFRRSKRMPGGTSWPGSWVFHCDVRAACKKERQSPDPEYLTCVSKTHLTQLSSPWTPTSNI